MKINHMADWKDDEYQSILGLHLDPNYSPSQVDEAKIEQINKDLNDL